LSEIGSAPWTGAAERVHSAPVALIGCRSREPEPINNEKAPG